MRYMYQKPQKVQLPDSRGNPTGVPLPFAHFVVDFGIQSLFDMCVLVDIPLCGLLLGDFNSFLTPQGSPPPCYHWEPLYAYFAWCAAARTRIKRSLCIVHMGSPVYANEMESYHF